MVLVNGQASDQVSAHDRGFLYGQSLFETLAVSYGRPHLLDRHLLRLKKGCEVLGIKFPDQLNTEIKAVCDSISEVNRAVLRITLSMGVGGRGYKNPAQPEITRVLSSHHYPEYPHASWQDGIVCGVANIRLSKQPALAGIKHGNRLEQIMARNAWPMSDDGEPEWLEALMLDQAGQVIEGTQSNVFALNAKVLSTPKLSHSGVAGVMRDTILDTAQTLGVSVQRVSLSLADVERADAVFFSNSLIGVWPVKRLNDTCYNDLSFTHRLMNLLVENGAIPNF